MKVTKEMLKRIIKEELQSVLNEAGVDVEMELKTIIQDNWEKVSNAPYGQFKSIIAKLFSDKFPGEPIPSDKQIERASRDAYAPDRVLPAGAKRSSFPIDDEEEEF